MSRATADEVATAYKRAHAQQAWVAWLRQADDELARLAAAYPRSELFDAGRVTAVRDMLVGLIGDADALASLWLRFADARAQEITTTEDNADGE